MKHPVHSIIQPSGTTPERVVGIGFVVLLHIIAITAIVGSLAPNIVAVIEQPIQLIPIQKHDDPPPTPPQPPTVDLPTMAPSENVPPPTFTIADETISRPLGEVASLQPPPRSVTADTALSGIAGTHTIPPYPMAAIRMGEEGRVMLRLTISAEGNVASASVTQSSGFADLDQSAIAWVLAHWKYKPAIRGGVAVASATEAVVLFSLKNAR